MNIKSIENSLKTYRKIEAEIAAHDEMNSKIGREWENEAEAQVIACLKQDGITTDGLQVSVRPSWSFEKENGPEIYLCWKVSGFDFRMEYQNGSFKRTSVSGISGSGDDFGEIADYYWMVSKVLNDMRHLDTNNPNGSFFKAYVATLTRPEYKTWEGMSNSEVRENINALERELKANEMDLDVGGKVEIFIDGTNRWNRGGWFEGEVISVTAKNYKISARGWNYLVKKEEITLRCRPVESNKE